MRANNILAIAAALSLGFFVGRYSVEPTTVETIRYTQLPPIRDTVWKDSIRLVSSVLTGPTVYVPVYIDRPDSLKHEPAVIDTVASIEATLADWRTKREYKATLFDRSDIGVLSLRASVQYNQLQNVKYDYLPMRREVVAVPKWQPFVSARMTTFGTGSIGFGLMRNRIGIEGLYIHDFSRDRRGVGIGVVYRFR